MGEREVKKRRFYHRPDAEWLSQEICDSYRKKALDLKLAPETVTVNPEWRRIRQRLMNLCDIPELMAGNILQGIRTEDYIKWHEWYKKQMEAEINGGEHAKEREKREFEQWQEEKRLRQEMDDRNQYNDFSFEEKDD